LGLSIAAAPGPADAELADCGLAGVPVLHPAKPASPARAPSKAAADSATRARDLFIAKTAYCGAKMT
jgi:hypothetical protein